MQAVKNLDGQTAIHGGNIMTGLMAVTLGVTAFVVGTMYGAAMTWFVMQRIKDNAD